MSSGKEIKFSDFVNQLKRTNSTLDSFVDFIKVQKNARDIATELEALDSLIGSDDLETSIKSLCEAKPAVKKVLVNLIAIRELNREFITPELDISTFDDYLKEPSNIYSFMLMTGLAEIMIQRKISSFKDYYYGMEVGLDTNARKNRGGKLMANTVRNLLSTSGLAYREEVQSTEFRELDVLGSDIKRFDFVVPTRTSQYLIETNFYNSGGSKLNETARSYTELHDKLSRVSGYTFVWITDGQGWHTAKNKLEEAYHSISHVYNLFTLPTLIAQLQREV